MLLAILLVLGAVIWVRINGPVEGRVLLELAEERGITTADLLSLIALVMAVVLAWPSRSAPGSPRRDDALQPLATRPAAPQQPPPGTPRRPGPPSGPPRL
ncbi:hypothetical protein [Actinomycetospora sp. CA-084318]|uniref:hypothetical protein n=1 Tax=Actinomycetospora sp. CA-084318 TaxID=3239892 RepID=UPI003D996D78